MDKIQDDEQGKVWTISASALVLDLYKNGNLGPFYSRLRYLAKIVQKLSVIERKNCL